MPMTDLNRRGVGVIGESGSDFGESDPRGDTVAESSRTNPQTIALAPVLRSEGGVFTK